MPPPPVSFPLGHGLQDPPSPFAFCLLALRKFPPCEDLPLLTLRGSLACRWSPDGEVLALLTAEAHVVLMSAKWEVLDELELEEALQERQQDEGRAKEGILDWRGDGQLLGANVAWESG